MRVFNLTKNAPNLVVTVDLICSSLSFTYNLNKIDLFLRIRSSCFLLEDFFSSYFLHTPIHIKYRKKKYNGTNVEAVLNRAFTLILEQKTQQLNFF